MEAAKEVLTHIPGVDPRVAQRAQFFTGMNDGPAKTAARIAGLVQKKDAKDDSPYYTSNFGQVMPDASHSLNVGGLPVQSDAFLLEKQQAFDRSKTVERVVHPCGSSAFGRFEVTQDVSHLTKADFLQPGKITPAYTRFSTVTYGREYPDSARNPRGFAVKFYTSQGNYDLVGLNYPVFFNRDPFHGPDVIRSQQRNPKSFLVDYNAWFDFLAMVPEAQHAGLMLMSDHSTPVGWRFFNAYGVHTFTWVNAAGEHVFVKYHWLSEQGTKRFTHEEAIRQSGENPDFAKQDLFEHIEKGGVAEYTMMVQIMKPEEAASVTFDPFDPTKVWPRAQFPMREVGKLTLDRNPEDYHRDVEQAAFSPGSYVPGIQTSPDPLLNWRSFFYRDAQMHRLGSANIHQIPVNCPFMASYHSPDNFAGTMRVDGNAAGKPIYQPSVYSSHMPTTTSAPACDASMAEAPMQLASNVLSRKSHSRHEGTPSEYDQVRELYTRVMTDQQRHNLHSNTARLLQHADPIVQKAYLVQQYAIAPGYATAIHELIPADKKVGYTLAEVAGLAPTAHLVGKNEAFRLKDLGVGFMGQAVGAVSLAKGY